MSGVMSERERGAGTILTLGIVAALLSLTILGVAAAGIFLSHQRLARAADAAALAAADTLSGRISGYPCDNAGRIAELASAGLEHCDIDGSIAFVSLTKREAGMALRAQARAGPADLSGAFTVASASSSCRWNLPRYAAAAVGHAMSKGISKHPSLSRPSAFGDHARDAIQATAWGWL